MPQNLLTHARETFLSLFTRHRREISWDDNAENREFRLKRIKGKNNRIIRKSAKISSMSIEIQGSDNEIFIGDNSRIYDLDVYIRGNGNTINIGNGCRFVKGGSLWMEDDACTIEIGESTSFISAHLAATESGSSITIGRDCMFAYDIDVRTGDSHSIIDEFTGKRINPAADVTIGDHVWIAAHVIILKGVNIRDNCIVATGSVITKSSDESNVIYAGNPAKIVKKNVTWSRQRI
jgi:acetyltransferase-like isoleucine patch superfamily enzyme